MRRDEIITGSHALFSVLSEPCHDGPVQTYGVAHKKVRLILIYLCTYIEYVSDNRAQ